MKHKINKHILIISQYFPPDITAAAFRIKETADILNKKGYKITVLTAKPHRTKLNEIDEICDNQVNVIRVPLILYREKGKWNYILHYSSFMIFAIIIGLIRISNKVDIVFASSPPLFVGVAGFVISKCKKTKFALDIRDIWPDAAVVAGQLSKKSLFYKYAKKVEFKLYMKAHLISCVAKPMAEYISNIIDQDKVVVVYNGVPEKYLTTSSLNHENKHNLIKKDKINVVYVGNMGYCQNLKVVLEAAKKIKEEDLKEFIFYLIGEGVEKEKLLKLKAKYALDNVLISGPVNKNKAIELIKNSSALLLQLKDDGIMEKTIPSKMFDYMIAGKPILFGIKGEGKKILQNIKGNIFFSPNSTNSFLNALKILKENYKQLADWAKENRKIVQKYYVREKLIEGFENHIQRLFKNEKQI